MGLLIFFDVLSALATWFRVQPHYKIKTCEVWICQYCKLCAVLKITVLVVVHVMSLYCRIKSWYNSTTMIMYILDIVLSFVECSITILIIWRSAFGNLNDWKKCLPLMTKQILKKNNKLKLFSRFCIIPLALTTISGCFWTNIVGFDTYKYFIVGDIERYYNSTLFFFYMTLIDQVRKDFRDLNSLLVDMTNNMKSRKLETKDPVRQIKVNPWTASCVIDISKAYLTIYEFTRSINRIFGWQILLLMAHAVIVMLNLLYSSVWLIGQKAFGESDVTVLLYVNITLTLWSMVSKILICVVSCL